VLDSTGAIRLDDLVDAAGSRVAPSGAPATGYGGTAPRPAGSDLPWLVLVGAGVLLGVAGVRKATRPAGAHATGGRTPPAIS